MTFAAPLFFALAALAVPITVLYILKVRRRRVGVAYLRLWEQLVVETRARSLFQRLKRLLSLLLQLAILASLVLALTRPAFELASVKKESVVLLLDTSASMGALEGDAQQGTRRTRFERMLERAREVVDARSHEDEMLVATVSDRVDVLASFQRDTLRLREALTRVTPTLRALDLPQALAFAREVTAGRENPLVLLVSDGGAAELAAQDEGAPPAMLLPVGEATENVGITRFVARKNSSLGTDYVLASVQNFGRERAAVRCELLVQEQDEASRTAKVVDLDLAPGEEHRFDWQFRFPAGATLLLRATSEGDRLPADDEAWAIVRSTRLRKVVLAAADVPTAAEYFGTALTAMGEVISADTFVTSLADYATLPAEERDADVTVFVGGLPSELPARGNLVLMDTPLPEFLPAELRGVDPTPTVWDWDREHTLNRFLNWRDLPLPPARILRLRAGDALVETFEGPLVAAFDLPERRVVYVAFDMLAELFPFRLAFPILFRNAIAWFEVEEDELIEPSYAPGEVIQPLRRVGVDRVHVSFLDDAGQPATRSLDVTEGRFFFDETERQGAYVVRVGGIPHPTAINLFDPRESDIAPDDPPAEGAGPEVGRHFLNRDLWAVLAACGLLLWTLEWWTYHRRITE